MASKAKTYITIAGDTFDAIAYKQYGDDHMCDKLMDANRSLIDYLIFPAGIEVTIPARDSFTTENVDSDFPDWRSVLNG
jgi:phage tail protein X